MNILLHVLSVCMAYTRSNVNNKSVLVNKSKLFASLIKSSKNITPLVIVRDMFKAQRILSQSSANFEH